MVDWGPKGNPLLDAVQGVSIFPKELSREEAELERMRGPRVADRIEDDERFYPKPKPSDTVVNDEGDELPRWLVAGDDCVQNNGDGSYEALMGGWFGAQAGGHSLDTQSAAGTEGVRP